MADRQRVVPVRRSPNILGDEEVAGSGAHRPQHIWVADAAALNLVRYHALTLRADWIVRGQECCHSEICHRAKREPEDHPHAPQYRASAAAEWSGMASPNA